MSWLKTQWALCLKSHYRRRYTHALAFGRQYAAASVPSYPPIHFWLESACNDTGHWLGERERALVLAWHWQKQQTTQTLDYRRHSFLPINPPDTHMTCCANRAATATSYQYFLQIFNVTLSKVFSCLLLVHPRPVVFAPISQRAGVKLLGGTHLSIS